MKKKKSDKKVIEKIEEISLELFALKRKVKSKKGKQELFNAIWHLNNIEKYEKRK